MPMDFSLELTIGTAVRRTATLTGIKATLDLQADGPMATSLDGPVRLTANDLQLRELSVEEMVCKAAATLNKEALTARFEPLTRIEHLDVELDFADGIGTVRTLTATLPVMRLDGSGTIALAQRRLALQLDARITGDLEARDPACRMTRRMQRVEWPISCNASFDAKPAKWCGIDKNDLAEIAGQLASEKLTDKLKDKLGELFRRN
jgi:hypothetical protein